ncbi:MAG TPA: 16S rRNA (cytosine(1402)-N(4))-methyltransferase RsmH, partial [Clostridiales bacterium]|nr:16S rRNA (cytosine(1402)-N(4))-methyltransferase RsmH [Clostridiales bacterium]
DGIYVDATAGGGGHSAAILERLTNEGRLLCLDQDPDAIRALTKRFGEDPRVTVLHDNFQNIKAVLKEQSVEKADGILADLGVSSHQLDTEDRGFSFHIDAPLDMRMSREGPTAADLCNTLSAEELKHILFTYGEEKYAASIANAIVRAREETPIQTTLQLSNLIASAMPAKARRAKHPARRSFQALRIAVNRELDVLDSALNDMFDCLKEGGVLSVITFHSLEDRMVKQRFASFCRGCICPPEFPVCVCGRTPAGKQEFKFRSATEQELEENARSRSAKLRAIEKVHERYMN